MLDEDSTVSQNKYSFQYIASLRNPLIHLPKTFHSFKDVPPMTKVHKNMDLEKMIKHWYVRKIYGHIPNLYTAVSLL